MKTTIGEVWRFSIGEVRPAIRLYFEPLRKLILQRAATNVVSIGTHHGHEAHLGTRQGRIYLLTALASLVLTFVNLLLIRDMRSEQKLFRELLPPRHVSELQVRVRDEPYARVSSYVTKGPFHFALVGCYRIAGGEQVRCVLVLANRSSKAEFIFLPSEEDGVLLLDSNGNSYEGTITLGEDSTLYALPPGTLAIGNIDFNRVPVVVEEGIIRTSFRRNRESGEEEQLMFSDVLIRRS